MPGWREKVYNRVPIPVQNRILSWHGRRMLRERFGPEYDTLMSFFEESQWYSREELEAYQAERLQRLIRHAYETVPYYRDMMSDRGLTPADIRTEEDLVKLSVLTKHDVRGNRSRLLSISCDRPSLREAYTSGSTGPPIGVFWDSSVTVVNNASLWRCRRWGGFEFGRPYAALMVHPIVPESQSRPPYWRWNESWNQLLLSSLHLRDDTVVEYVSEMRRVGVEALETYPSSAYVFAKHMEAIGERLPLTCVFTTSEPLLDVQREIVEDRFCCPVFDAYSQAERVMFSGECDRHVGHHVHEEYGITELLDEHDEPVAPGTMGRVVATGLHNFAMPLIRYEVGDAAAFRVSPCECGRGLRLLEGVSTKADDILVLPDGRLLPATPLMRAFKGFPGIEQIQVVQHEPQCVTVRMARTDEFASGSEQGIRDNLRVRLGDEVRIIFEYVDVIPRSSRGKFRTVISTVPLSWGNVSTSNLYQPD